MLNRFLSVLYTTRDSFIFIITTHVNMKIVLLFCEIQAALVLNGFKWSRRVVKRRNVSTFFCTVHMLRHPAVFISSSLPRQRDDMTSV